MSNICGEQRSDESRPVALICDIVGSRNLVDRRGAHEKINEAFQLAERHINPVISMWPTVGDEYQALYATEHDALSSTLRVCVSLPEGVILRFGLGKGVSVTISEYSSSRSLILDGCAWHHARSALEMAKSRRRGLSTAFNCCDPELSNAIDSQVVLRDHIVARLKARERRLAARLLDGSTQAGAATAERVTQSAVSQAVRRSGIDSLLWVTNRRGAIELGG